MYEDLALASFFGVIYGIERIVQDTSLDHSRGAVGALNPRSQRYRGLKTVCGMRFSARSRGEVSIDDDPESARSSKSALGRGFFSS